MSNPTPATTLDQATAAAIASKIRGITAQVLERNIGRGDVVLATLLALVSGKPAIFIGPPGVTKTGTIRALVALITGARYYRALMPGVIGADALFYESTVIRESGTEGDKKISMHGVLGRAAEVEIFFADEAFKTPPPVLNPLLDFANGDGIEHEGVMIKPPLRAFLAASNELPEAGSGLEALWSRMNIRVLVAPLSWDMKDMMVSATIGRKKATGASPSSITLAEIDEMRILRHLVAVPDTVMKAVREICQQKLVDAHPGEFDHLFEGDRSYKRIFDVLQAHALLHGRTQVSSEDLSVLKWLLWNTPEQVPTVESVVAPYCRTPVSEAKGVVQDLLVPDGHLAKFYGGDFNSASKGIAAVDGARNEIDRLIASAGADAPILRDWVAKLLTLRGEVGAAAGNPTLRRAWSEIQARFS